MSKSINKQLVIKQKQDGASMIEYVVIAALVVVAAVASLKLVSGSLTATFTKIISALS